MAKLYVIKTGQTTFEEQSRVDSTAGAPLSAQGLLDVQTAARELADQEVGSVYVSPAEAETQTGRLVGMILGVKVRTVSNLREIDYGLWQGLTVDEIKRRQPKVYRQWSEVPTTVCPPGGETVQEVQERLCKAVEGIVKKQKNGAPLLVLRPVALGLLRCLMEEKPLEELWTRADSGFTWCSYETSKIPL